MDMVPVVLMFALPLLVAPFAARALARHFGEGGGLGLRIFFAVVGGCGGLLVNLLLTITLQTIRESSLFAIGGNVTILFWEITLGLAALSAFAFLPRPART